MTDTKNKSPSRTLDPVWVSVYTWTATGCPSVPARDAREHVNVLDAKEHSGGGGRPLNGGENSLEFLAKDGLQIFFSKKNNL